MSVSGEGLGKWFVSPPEPHAPTPEAPECARGSGVKGCFATCCGTALPVTDTETEMDSAAPLDPAGPATPADGNLPPTDPALFRLPLTGYLRGETRDAPSRETPPLPPGLLLYCPPTDCPAPLCLPLTTMLKLDGE